MGLVALAPRGEDHGKRALVALGLHHGVGGELALDGVERLAELVLDVEDGVAQPLLHRLHHHGADGVVALEPVGVAREVVTVGGEVEVEVLDGAELGGLARERRDGGDELLGLELVAEVALVGVGLLGLAALDGAAADHLAAVKELAGARVVELQGRAAGEHARVLQAVEDLVGHLLVDLCGGGEGAAAKEVACHVVAGKGRRLTVVVLPPRTPRWTWRTPSSQSLR